MKIVDILSKDAVKVDLQARDKESVIEEISELVVRSAGLTDKQVIVQVLMEREALGSTGIGLNVAIPHAKLQGVDSIIAALARSKEGIDFGSIDGQPVMLFFVLISGVNTARNHLKALAKISRLLKNDETREALISCNCSVEMYEIVSREESKLD